MRGPSRRQSPRLKAIDAEPSAIATAATTSVPAAVGGWNARDSIAAMKPLDAVVMDNFYPGTASVDLRAGSSSWATGMSGTAGAFLTWAGQLTQELFCATSTGIYDVTASGVVGAAVVACTSSHWVSVNITTSGGHFLFAANGVDKIELYDGATWTALDGASVPAITGVTTTSIRNLCLFKRRIWMLENNSMTAWYLPVDSIAGAAAAFPMGPLFTRGGHLVAQATWTIDGGNGLDDFLLTVTSEGELAIYQGTDPASSSTFALVGVFYVGEPIGHKCFCKYGGDLLYISKKGVMLLSKLLLSASIDRSQSEISYKIAGAFNSATELYSANYGWSATVYPSVNAVVVNVPIFEGEFAYQFVMNGITKAWCRFLNWNASDFIVWEEQLYFCSGTFVRTAWVGVDDDGFSIQGMYQQAYTNLSYNGQKSISMVRPKFSIDLSATIQVGMDSDFQAYGADSSVSYINPAATSFWDSALWDSAVWAIDPSPVEAFWRAIPSKPGYFHSFRLQITTSTARFSFIAADYAIQPAGIL